MLRKLEEIFGFRTNENTNVANYLNRMDAMGKLDGSKQNKLLASVIEKIIESENKANSLEQLFSLFNKKLDDLSKTVEKLNSKPEPKLEANLKQDISTMKADITRIKKKVYPTA